MKESVERRLLGALLCERSQVVSNLLAFGVTEVVTTPVVKPIILFTKSYFDKYGKLPSSSLILDTFPNNSQLFIDIVNDYNPTEEQWLYDEVVREIKRHRLRKLVERVLQSFDDPNVDPAEVWEYGRNLLYLPSTDSEIVDYLDSYFIYHRDEDPSRIIKTGISDLDSLIDHGMRKGWFGVVAAGSGIGKSSFLITIAINAIKEGKKVLYISLEMPQSDIVLRCDANLTKISINLLRNKLEIPRYEVQVKKMKDLIKKSGGEMKIIYYPSKSIPVTRLPGILTTFQLKYNFTPDIVIIDFADMFAPLSRRTSVWEEAADIFHYLPGYAKEHDIVIWTATEIGKKEMYNLDADLSAIYGSSEKAFGADLVLALIAKTEDDSRAAVDTSYLGLTLASEYSLRVLKNRHGRKANINLFFYKDISYFDTMPLPMVEVEGVNL